MIDGESKTAKNIYKIKYEGKPQTTTTKREREREKRNAIQSIVLFKLCFG